MLERFVKNIIEKEGRKSVSEISVDSISVNPYQTRREFDHVKLEELAQSIREQGVIQPIIVRKLGSGYELVAGERRLRASKIAGLSTIPAIVRHLGEQEMIEITFIENLQREQLNDIETAEAFGQLVREQVDSLENISSRVGKNSESIKDNLWVMQLPQVIKKAVVSKLISLNHAKLLSKIASEKKQLQLLEKIYRENLDAEQTKHIIEKMPDFLKMRPLEQNISNEAPQKYNFQPENLKQLEACLRLIRELISAMRSSGIDVNVSELFAEQSFNIKLSFPLGSSGNNG